MPIESQGGAGSESPAPAPDDRPPAGMSGTAPDPDAPGGSGDGTSEPEAEGRAFSRMMRRAAAARARGVDFVAELEGLRPENPLIEIGFRWLARDKRIAGGILGGGLAYRFFFWALGLSVLTSGGLGLASKFTNLQSSLKDAGLSDSLAGSASDVADQSAASRIWLIIVGGFLVIWFGWGVLRALWLVHAAAWDVDPPPLQRIPQGLAGVVSVPFVLVLLTGAATWVRARIGLLPGLLATLGVAIVFGAFWLWVQTKLPSRKVHWTAFVPGAVMITLGLEAMHLFTAYFLTDKLESASSLYGVLGIASTLLFLLFMLGRIIVWGAELNAVAWDVMQERGAEGRALLQYVKLR